MPETQIVLKPAYSGPATAANLTSEAAASVKLRLTCFESASYIMGFYTAKYSLTVTNCHYDDRHQRCYSTRCEHDSHPLDGWGGSSRLWPSGHPHGPCSCDLSAVDRRAAIRPRSTALAQPRSIRAFLRPCLDADLFDAPFSWRPQDRIRRHRDRGFVGHAGRPPQFPPMGQRHAWAS